MPKLTNEEIRKIESFLAEKAAKPCQFCGKGPIDAKQNVFLSLPLGFDNKAINLLAAVCENCKHVYFFSYDEILQSK
jgi:hypothetical protein